MVDITVHIKEGSCPLGKFDGLEESTTIQQVPRKQWPLWAKTIAEDAEDPDKGVGDTVARLLGRMGDLFKATMTALGVPCGCSQRQAEWNALYPYATMG